MTARFRSLSRSAVVLVALALAGCQNPNFIGLQEYGTIYGNVVNSSGAAIVGAVVSSTGSLQPITSSPTGAFTLMMVATGEQTVTVSAAGFTTATAVVQVTQNQSVNAGNITLQATTSTPISK